MALRKTVATVYGISVGNAYHRVEALVLPQKDRMNFHVRSYANATGEPFFAEDVHMGVDYDLNGPNPIEQAYEYVKALPVFSGAVDC